MTEQQIRGAAILTALSLLRVPYVYGGKDPIVGLDCSGFAECVLAGGGITLPEENADTLFRSMDPVLEADSRPGDLVFYGTPDKATHVAVVLSSGGRAIIGANGGGRPHDGESFADYQVRMKSQEAAVRIEDWRHGGAHWRMDLIGYRRLPIEKAHP